MNDGYVIRTNYLGMELLWDVSCSSSYMYRQRLGDLSNNCIVRKMTQLGP